MEKGDNNSKKACISDLSENENNLETVEIPKERPIARKANFFSESKPNKRSEKKPKINQQQANNKIKFQTNNIKIQNKNPQKVSNLPNNNSNYSNITSKVGSNKSSKTKNSILNSLNSSFSSMENLYNPKNNLSKNISPFTNNFININIQNSTNNSSKRSNLKYGSNENNNNFNRQKNASAFNQNIKRTLIVEKENTKKFTQQVASKLNKDTGFLAKRLKNEQNGINADPDLKRSFLKELLFRNIYNLEVDACQKQINQMMMDFTEISHEVINAKAECNSEVEFFQMKKDNCAEEIEELEEELRKFETEKALVFQEDKEILDKLEELRKKENEMIELEKKIDYDIFSLEQMSLGSEEQALAQLEKEKNQDAHLHQFFEELTDIRRNMTVLKPFFKKFIVLRGLEKRNFSRINEANNNIVKINEEENSLRIIIPKSTSSNEMNDCILNNSNPNTSQEIIKFNNCLYENHLIFFDEIFTLYENKLMLLDNIMQNNTQDAILNKDISGIFSAYFSKSLAYSDKDKKDFFCFYISDPIKLTQANENHNSNPNNNSKKVQISLNKNVLIALEKQIKEFFPMTAFDANCFLIAKDDLIPYSSFKNIEIRDTKKFDLNIIKFDKNQALNALEKNKHLELFTYKKNEAKSILMNRSEIELSNYKCENYFYSESFINFLMKHINRGVYGIYIKITCLKNNSELKFLYSDINQTTINNEILKKLSEMSNKHFKKIKTTKKADFLPKEENKLLNLILDKTDFSNVKHSCCFLDLNYHLDLGLNGNSVSSFFGDFKEKDFYNLDKEYDYLAYEGKSDTKVKLNLNNISQKKGSDNVNSNCKNALSRSNSFNKGSSFTNNNNNNHLKNLNGKNNSNNRRKDTGSALKEGDRSAGKSNSNNNISNKISPNNHTKNPNSNLNNVNNIRVIRKLNDNTNRSRDNSNNNNNIHNLVMNPSIPNLNAVKNKENLNPKLKDNDHKYPKNNALENIKNFDKQFLSVDSENEIHLKIAKENKSNFKDLMDLEVLSINDANAEAKPKNEMSVFYNNLDSFGKSHKNNLIAEKKTNEGQDKLMQAEDKFHFNFDYRKFDEIIKYFKEK